MTLDPIPTPDDPGVEPDWPDGPPRRLADLWRQGGPVEPGRVLPDQDDLVPPQLVEVLRVDQWHRWHRGLRPPAGGYLRDFPRLRTDPEAAFDLIWAEFLIREGLGEAPELDEYERLYPEFATLLRTQLEVHRALSTDANQTVTFRMAGPGPLPTAPDGPRQIGRYHVVERLGGGGQAEVYRVVHGGIGKELVLKVARRPSPPGSLNRAALVAEARRLAEFDHPGVVRVYDLDVHEGRPFLVLEYVPGRNLRQVSRNRPPPPRQAARWLTQVADVLEAAHRRGLYHMDIKPENLLIDASGHARVIDFGVARLQHAWSPEGDVPLSGTLAYMAPEQARGEPADAAADIFALGSVLYSLLVGHPPFTGRSTTEVWDKARRCCFDRDALDAPGIPRDLARIALKAMADRPEDRYASAAELARSLRRSMRRTGRAAALAGLVALAGITAEAWLRTAPPPASPPSPTPDRSASAASTPLPALEPLGPIVVEHFRYLGDSGRFLAFGELGDRPDPVRVGDDLRIRARLSAPAYCYLLAINPDGSLQLCHPDDPATPPAPASRLDFPGAEQDYFGLTDGAGLQAFVLVASRSPLPPFEGWAPAGEAVFWTGGAPSGVWEYDGRAFRLLSSEAGPSPVRGEVRPRAAAPAPFADACRRLGRAPDVDLVCGVAFPVVGDRAGAESQADPPDEADPPG